MFDQDVIDLSEVIETFDVDENRRLLEVQLEDLHNDACERFIDNFKMLYSRFASIRDQEPRDPDVFENAKDLFYDICSMYIDRIADEFDITVDDQFIEDNWEDLPSVALQFYLFFVLDFRSNLSYALFNYIGNHLTDIANQFEGAKQRRDAFSESNKVMEDPDTALIASNIYDVVDWIMEQLDAESFLDLMEPGYVALEPMKKMVEEGTIDGVFVPAIGHILRENISLKGRICFDIICKLQGYDLED